MDILNLIEVLEEAIESAWKIPFTSRCFVDKDELLDSLQDIRLKLPEELKQAKRITEERQRILIEAQKEADNILKNTADRVNVMVNEHEITKLATEEAAIIKEKNQNECREMRMATREYVTQTLENLEQELSSILQRISEDKSSVE